MASAEAANDADGGATAFGVVGGACLSTAAELDADVESLRFFLSRRTLLEMLSDRGYSVDPVDLFRTQPEFLAWWNVKPEPERLTISTTLLSDPSKKVLVLYLSPDPVKVSTIRAVVNQTKGQLLNRLILVLQSKMTSKARDAIKENFAFKIETFQITDLLVNITKHVLKPKHEVLTSELKAELLKKYNVNDEQLPRMLETDAITRYYGLEKGTVVEVSYNGDLTGNHVAYRCVM